MKKTLILLTFLTFYTSITQASTINNITYNGQVIEIQVTPKTLTNITFPETIIRIIRSQGMKDYEILKSDENVLLVTPLLKTEAEAIVVGKSGENYSLKFVINEVNDAKVIIANIREEIIASKKMLNFIDKNPPNVVVEANINKEEVTAENNQKSIDEKRSEYKAIDKIEKISKNTQGIIQKEEKLEIPHQLNQKITIKGNGLPLKVYLNAISKVTGFNIIAPRYVENEKVSINVADIEVWRALKSLLYPLSYGFKVSKEDILILSSETRIFEIQFPAIIQSFNDVTSNESFTEQGSSEDSGKSVKTNQNVKVGTKILVESKSPEISLWEDLEQNLQNLITPEIGTFTINRASSMVVVKDLPAILDKIGVFIDEVNKSISKQQSFEIQIIEVTLKDEFEAGIDFNALARNLKGLNNISAVTNFSAAGFAGGQLLSLTGVGGKESTAGKTSSGISAVVKALEDMGKVEIISKPSITTSNLVPCVLQEGTSRTFISESGSTFNDSSTSTTVSTSQVHEGLTMRILSKIGDLEKNEPTVLNLSVSVTNIDSIDNVTSGDVTIQTPKVSTKSISTNVKVKQAESLIIGGLISTTKTKGYQGVPVVSRIPILGNLFKYQSRKNNKEELVIIITPKASI